MTRSLRALLTGIIDYAGLFPPAQLPLEQAVQNYARYRQAPESWMLARFICPVDSFAALCSLSNEDATAENPWPISLLNPTSEGLTQAGQHARQTSGRVVVDCLELRVPPLANWARDPMPYPILGLLHSNAESASPMPVFCETTLETDWQPPLTALATALNQQLPSGRIRGLGMKFRCGGTEAAAFPTVEQVAFVIALCRNEIIPMKFTAGLHHPIRHYNDSVQTKMHGFINVFVAGVMAHARGLSAVELQPLLEEENPAAFSFIDDGVHWRDCFATTGEIVAARQHFVTSFGSCSFDEPRDDLRALGWM